MNPFAHGDVLAARFVLYFRPWRRLATLGFPVAFRSWRCTAFLVLPQAAMCCDLFESSTTYLPRCLQHLGCLNACVRRR